MTITGKDNKLQQGSLIQQAVKGQEIKAKTKSPATRMRDVLNMTSSQQLMEEVLKENKETFVASLIDLYNGDTYLQKCNPAEVLAEALKAVSLNLPINKQLGFVYILPYGNKPSLVLGYRGHVQLALRTGEYTKINADVVYEGQYKGMDMLSGDVDLVSEDKVSDKIIGYFAYIRLKNGFSKTIYKTKEDIIKHANRFSQSYKSGSAIWKEHFDAMAIKTVLRELLGKWGMYSVSYQSAVNDELYIESELLQEADEAIIADAEVGEVIDAETGEVL